MSKHTLMIFSAVALIGCGGSSFNAFGPTGEEVDGGGDARGAQVDPPVDSGTGGATSDVDSGAPSSGGSEAGGAASGGASTGGASSGGAHSSGGANAGGSSSGGATHSGGASSTGGASSSGGTSSTGGVTNTGGVTGSGGAVNVPLCCKFVLASGTTFKSCEAGTPWLYSGGQTYSCQQEGLCAVGASCYLSSGPFGGTVAPCQ